MTSKKDISLRRKLQELRSENDEYVLMTVTDVDTLVGFIQDHISKIFSEIEEEVIGQDERNPGLRKQSFKNTYQYTRNLLKKEQRATLKKIKKDYL